MGKFLDPPQQKGKFLDDEPEKPQIEDTGFVEQLIQGPGRDIASGLLQGNIAVSKPLSSVSEFVGVPDESNIFKQGIQSSQNLLENLPASTTPQPARSINELLGSAPGITAEFLQGGAVLKGTGIASRLAKSSGRALTPAAELAVTSALEELNNGAPQVLEAAKDAATIGLGFPAGLTVAGKGMGLLKRGFKEGARKLIQISTNNKRLADDFVENPFKYSLRFFDKNVKTVKEAMRRNKEIKQALTDKQKVELESLRASQKQARNELAIKQKESAENVRARAVEVKEQLTREGASKVDDVQASTQSALAEQREILAQNLDDGIGSTILVAEKMKQQEGQLVGDAIEGIVSLSPDAGIPLKTVMAPVNKILQDGAKRGLFRFNTKVKVTPQKDAASQLLNKGDKVTKTREGVTAVTDGQREIAGRVNSFLDDLNRLKNEKGEVPLEVLQGLKSDSKKIAQQAFKAGDNNTGVLFGNLSSNINPAKLASDNPVVAKKLGALVEANAKFSNQIKPYNDLISLVSTTDANGNIVTNVGTVVNGVKNNNTQIINRLRKIDAKLPAEEQVLPKLRSYIADVDRAITNQKAALKQVKRGVSDALKAHAKKTRELNSNINRANQQDRFKFGQEQRDSLVGKMKEQETKLRQAQSQIDDEINFLEDQDAIRSFQGVGMSGLLQRVFAFGTVLPAFTGMNPAAGLGGLAVTAGLSPNVIGSGVQTATRLNRFLNKNVSPVLEEVKKSGAERLAQRVLASNSQQ